MDDMNDKTIRARSIGGLSRNPSLSYVFALNASTTFIIALIMGRDSKSSQSTRISNGVGSRQVCVDLSNENDR